VAIHKLMDSVWRRLYGSLVQAGSLRPKRCVRLIDDAVLEQGRLKLFYRLKNALKDRLRFFLWFLKLVPTKLMLFGARGLYIVLSSRSSIAKESIYPPDILCRSSTHWMAMTGERLGADFIKVDSSCIVPNRLPKTPDGHVRQQLAMDHNYEWPETFVVTIPGGRVWGTGHIITPDNQLLDDVSVDFRAVRWTLRPKTSSVVRYWSFQNPAEYKARVAVLATDGAGIYFHWFFQLLPRFELIRRAGVDIDSIEYFVVNDVSKPFQRESIKALGIEPSRIIESSKVPYLTARELIVPSIPIGSGCYWSWMCQFLRVTFLGTGAGRRTGTVGRRVYISRGLASYRRVLNEADVIRLLRRHGFEEIRFEQLSMWEQAESMASCEAVVAPHGAGLSNIVFCSPGTKVIEIFSPELVTGYFWKLSNQMNLDYYYILGKGPPATLLENYQQSWNAKADITVDLSTLSRALELSKIV
jgi:capsular polysaccharide biosynthesis protein